MNLAPIGRLMALGAAVASAAVVVTPMIAASEDASLFRLLRDSIVVANRGGGSISVIDPRTDRLVGTVPLPSGPATPEPMYVVDGGRRRAIVGDRANNRLVVFESRTFRPIGTAPAGRGIWHMWSGGGQLWVMNDIDKTASVFDVNTLQTLATVPMPADLVAQGGRPHDVVLDPHHGRYAYVTMVGLPGPADYVVKYSARTFEEVGRAAVGKDPHVSMDDRYEQVFVAAQGSSKLHVLDAGSLEILSTRDVPGAHGTGMFSAGDRFYATNLPGGGIDALFTFDTRTNAQVGQPVDAPFPTPHNIALTPDGRKLYVTHSGPAATEVSVYRTWSGWALQLERTVNAGLNPFGIAFVR